LAGSRAVIDANADRRPALVTVEYRIAPERRDAVLNAIKLAD
jgi:hypothetical protein